MKIIDALNKVLNKYYNELTDTYVLVGANGHDINTEIHRLFYELNVAGAIEIKNRKGYDYIYITFIDENNKFQCVCGEIDLC